MLFYIAEFKRLFDVVRCFKNTNETQAVMISYIDYYVNSQHLSIFNKPGTVTGCSMSAVNENRGYMKTLQF